MNTSPEQNQTPETVNIPGFSNMQKVNLSNRAGRCDYFSGNDENGTKLFIKMAKESDKNPKIENEEKWLKYLATQDIGLKTPTLIKTGKSSDKAYTATEFVEGMKPLTKEDLQNNKNILAQIADSLVKITKLPEPAEEQNNPERKNIDWNKLKEMFSNSFRNNPDLISRTEKFINSAENLKKAPYHGNCRLNQFNLDQNDQLWLLDWDQARFDGILYYDIAHLFHIIWVKLDLPEVAENFLQQVHNRDSGFDTESEQWKLLLQRVYLGGMYEALALNDGNPEKEKEFYNKFCN